MAWLTAAVCALLFTLGAGSASANWGRGNACGVKSEPVNEHCYALAEDDIEAFAIVDLEETLSASVPNCGEGFVTQEAWATPESTGGSRARWVESGQIVGRGFCDQEPHIFSAEVAPTNNEFHFNESGLPSPEHQLNMYAISDIPVKGDWRTYYRIPNESNHWTEFESYGGGWSALMYEQEAGMEAADTSQPSYEGLDETLWTDESIEWPLKSKIGGSWTGAKPFSMAGDTCIAPVTGSGAGPGNYVEAVC